MKTARHILPVIVLAQFCCVSLWFAGNGVIGDLASTFQLPESSLGHLTSVVQFGFIVGTFLFALLTIADRFSPSVVFFFAAIAGALCNVLCMLDANSFVSLLFLRFLVGFALAGIYPVGMKIAADHFEQGLGKSLGFLVGALVLGTAFPHLLKSFSDLLSWKMVLISTSGLALFGGLAMWGFVPDGPYRKSAQAFNSKALIEVFKPKKFREAALGYFGHMWELYTFWTFVPLLIVSFTSFKNPSLHSFWIIALGSIACVVGAYLSRSFGEKRIATTFLLLSCLCCFVSPVIFLLGSDGIIIAFLICWGFVVIADSPLFSTLVAKNAPAEIKGTALTIVNSIGFAITIVSIQLLSGLVDAIRLEYLFVILALGPLIGLINLLKKSTS